MVGMGRMMHWAILAALVITLLPAMADAQPSRQQAPDPRRQIVPPSEYDKDAADPNYQWQGWRTLLTGPDHPEYRKAAGCDHAALKLVPFIAAIEDDGFPFRKDTIDDPPDTPLTVKDFIAAAHAFDTECLTQYNAAESSPDREIGVLFTDHPSRRTNFPQCTVVRLGPHLFATALHCLQEQPGASFTIRMARHPEDRIAVRWLPGREQMQSLGLRQGANVDGIDAPAIDRNSPPAIPPKTWAMLDYAILVPRRPLTREDLIVEVPVATDQPVFELDSFAYYHFLLLANFLSQCQQSQTSCEQDPDKIDASRLWPGALRNGRLPVAGADGERSAGSRRNSCKVVASGPSCLLHGCQETRASSGAPLLTRQGALAGLHVASVRDDHPSVCGGKKMHIGNIGLPVPAMVLDRDALFGVARDLKWTN